jgi:hypothetical protein
MLIIIKLLMLVLNDIEDAYTEVTTKDVAIVGYKMLDKVTAEPKERPCTHLWTDLMVTQTGGTTGQTQGWILQISLQHMSRKYYKK